MIIPIKSAKYVKEKKHRTPSNKQTNHHLSRVNEVLLTPSEFHPRKSAIGREYIYRIASMNDDRSLQVSEPHRPADLLYALPATEIYRVLPLPCFDVGRAQEVINLLRGEHDFASFSHAPKATDDTVRKLEIDLSPANHNVMDIGRSSRFSFYHLHFRSRAFLHNQIRRIVGALVTYATYRKIELNHIQHLLDHPCTKSWSPKILIAEPWGLYLSRIEFDKSSFHGTIRTHKNGVEEKAELFPDDEDTVG